MRWITGERCDTETVTHRSEGGRQKSIRQDNSLADYPTKRRVNPGLGFFSLNTVRRTIGGYEVTNMIRKGQVEGIGECRYESAGCVGNGCAIRRFFQVGEV